MADVLRVAVLGLTHDHVWRHLDELLACPGTELVGAADPHEALLKKFREQYNRPGYPAYDVLLDEHDPQAVYVFADNAGGVELTKQAAARGLHVLVEKPMAHTLAGADELLAAARKHDVRLMINWPFAWRPQLQHALRMAAEGEIGRVWQVKYRAAHSGPENHGCSEFFCDWLFDAERNGAGALMDYCCYGAVLARAVLGVPSRVNAIAVRACKEHTSLEDNAVLLMTYPRGLAVSEASWTQIGDLTSYTTVIYGDRGTLLIEPKPDGRLLLATVERPDGESISVPQPPQHLSNTTEHFAHCLATGEPLTPLCEARICRDAQEILEAGLIAAAEGVEQSLPLRQWAV